MKTKYVVILMTCLILAGVLPLKTMTASAEMNTSDKMKLFNSLSDEEKEIWIKDYPQLKSPPDDTAKPIKSDSEQSKDEKDRQDKTIVQPVSKMENILSGDFPGDVSKELRQYGYDFFQNMAISFTPNKNLPVGVDYIIGPGDNFKIHIWGKFESSYEVTVNREGGIIIPRLGTVYVSGLSYSEMKTHLYNKFKEFYTDFQISITMGELRTVGIFVVGEALIPGTYSVSSLSTLITALFEVKGPSKNGSLRNIQLIRNSKVIKNLDLYQFFLKGDKSEDHRLEPGDTIFIPVIGPVAGIAGNVKRPAIYELKEGENINDIINYAGGILPTGDLQNVVVERIDGHQKRVIKNFNIAPQFSIDKMELQTRLKDGDLVKIYPVHKEIRNVVTLEGHVKYPREYEYQPGMTLKDLIPSYEALLPEPYLNQGVIMRRVPPDYHTEIVEFNLGKMLEGNLDSNISLKELDRVIVYYKWEKETRPQVRIRGSVGSPGLYTLYEGMNIKDLIFQAGNITDKAYLEEGTLTRILVGENGTDNINLSFSPRKAINGELPDNIILEPDDTVYIRQIPKLNETLNRTVSLEGEFVFPGEYSFTEGERISSIIRKAGGITENGYPYGAVFERETIKEIQGKRFKDYMDSLEEEILTVSLKMAELSVDKDQAELMAQELTTKKQLLEKMKSSRPSGRMVINLDKILDNPDSENDFRLKSGDRLIINARPDYVNIMGEVYNPTALLFEDGKTVQYYLNRVGGLTEEAHEKQMYLVKANGDVISKNQESFFGLFSWDGKNQRWTVGRGFDSQKLDPGDTIIVPKKLTKYQWLTVTKSITEIMYQIAVTAGVIIVAY